MSGLFIVLSAVLGVACLCMIIAILMQKKRQAGFSGNIAGGAAEKTYYDKNKGRTLEGQLEKWTKILGTTFMILSFVISIYLVAIQQS